MHTNRHTRPALHWFLALAVLLISCDLSTLMPAQQVATPLPPQAIGTIIAQTAAAAQTQTATLLPPTETPTSTPVPSRTPSPTPSPTPTFLFLLPTLPRVPTLSTAEASGKDLSCALLSQDPEDGSVVAKGKSFPVTWTVQNTGNMSWDANQVDFIYSSGAKLASVKAVDLPKTVAAGDSIALKVTMEAPNGSDTYKTVWTLRSGKDTFCRLDVTVVVP